MNIIGSKLNQLNRKIKFLIVLLNDFFLALICWLVFGPPMASYIASEFSTGIFEIFLSEWISFFFPAVISISYLYFFGFYKSLIKFFDSKYSTSSLWFPINSSYFSSLGIAITFLFIIFINIYK